MARDSRCSLVGNYVNTAASGSFCGDAFWDRVHACVSWGGGIRPERNAKYADRLVARAQPPSLPLFLFHLSNRVAGVPLVFRFGAETMKSLSPVAIASKANAPAPMYFVPWCFFPIFQYVLFIRFQPLLSALSPRIQRLVTAKRCHQQRKCYQPIFPVTDPVHALVKTIPTPFSHRTRYSFEYLSRLVRLHNIHGNLTEKRSSIIYWSMLLVWHKSESFRSRVYQFCQSFSSMAFFTGRTVGN